MKKPRDIKVLVGEDLDKANQGSYHALPKSLIMAFEAASHTKDIDPATMQPYTSFHRWLWVMPPAGCGLCSYSDINLEAIIHILWRCRRNLTAKARAPVDALIEDLKAGIAPTHAEAAVPLAKPGGSRGPEQADVVSLTRHGNGAAYLSARIARDRPDVLARMKAGEFKSVRAAAVAAGIVRAKTPLDALHAAWRKATAAQRRQFLEAVREGGGDQKGG
jgi:hypothetical protein